MENEFSLFGSGTLTTNPPTCALILMVIKECGCRRKNTRLGASASESHSVPDKSGGLNGSTQHSSRTRLALKTKAKSLARVRSAGTRFLQLAEGQFARRVEHIPDRSGSLADFFFHCDSFSFVQSSPCEYTPHRRPKGAGEAHSREPDLK